MLKNWLTPVSLLHPTAKTRFGGFIIASFWAYISVYSLQFFKDEDPLTSHWKLDWSKWLYPKCMVQVTIWVLHIERYTTFAICSQNLRQPFGEGAQASQMEMLFRKRGSADPIVPSVSKSPLPQLTSKHHQRWAVVLTVPCSNCWLNHVLIFNNHIKLLFECLYSAVVTQKFIVATIPVLVSVIEKISRFY